MTEALPIAQSGLKDRPKSYPVAPNGIFWSVQGEGRLSGNQMQFLRLSGCSIGCPGCDTNYTFGERLTIPEIISRFRKVKSDEPVWVWITGGEPADHDLYPLLRALHDHGCYVAVATSGHKHIPKLWAIDWLSVSPHHPKKWKHKSGSELKVVPGLNGLELGDWAEEGDFQFRYVMPLSTAGHPTGSPENISQLLDWIRARPNWGITHQHHKIWNLP